MSKFNFATVNPKKLRANPWNTNKMTPANEEKLDQSLSRFGGLFKPIIVRDTPAGMEILGGEHRWESAMRVRMEEVPIFNLEPISDDEAKRISIADNARYGADDTLALAELLRELSVAEDFQEYLPYSDAELSDIFTSDIVLEDLDIELPDEGASLPKEEVEAKPPKTHTIMRFKVPLADAERITALVAHAQKDHGLTGSDELTNAGDALVHLLITERAA